MALDSPVIVIARGPSPRASKAAPSLANSKIGGGSGEGGIQAGSAGRTWNSWQAKNLFLVSAVKRVVKRRPRQALL